MSIREVIVTINKVEADGVIDRYAIGGAVGATLDIDVFVAFRAEPGPQLVSLKPVFDYLAARGYSMKGEYVMIAGWPVQFLPPTGPLVEEALAQAATTDVDGVPARVFGAEHLAAIALQTGRAKDKARLLQFIEEGAVDSIHFQELIRRHGLVDVWTKFERQFLGDTTP
ncbi:MAG TPA: hypothetical protein VNM92_14250 [Thermoanaerobaculia bacterium]|nr:hypothetical protein [Thermoanaerobaculia bacterium]